MRNPALLRDFQAQWESPLFGLFHAAAFSIAHVPTNCAIEPNFALVYQGLGNSNEALRWLEKAYEQRDVHMVFLPVDSKWDALRKNPHFMDLIKRLNLPILNGSSH